MKLSSKIKHSLEGHPLIESALKGKSKDNNWEHFTRTQFNIIARCINRYVTKEVLANTDLIELNLIIGQQMLNKQLKSLRCHSLQDLLSYLAGLGEYRHFNWVSGKTLQSYWNQGDAKFVKINTLLVFLGVPYKDWDSWQKDADGNKNKGFSSRSKQQESGYTKSSLSILKTYYAGNYFLYYQKTDGSKNIVKTPFVIRELENGQIQVNSVSEGHRYIGKLVDIRDGCLYINCQNLDFEEMEQYIFNIGLETKPHVLFGVSNTVSVKKRQAVALKNILVKQKTEDIHFNQIAEIEIPFHQKLNNRSEDAIVLNYFKNATDNIIITPSCCTLDDLREMSSLK